MESGGVKCKFTVQAIRDSNEIRDVQDEIDAFVTKWSNNPLLLTGFISQFMNSSRAKGWTPLFLLVKNGERIVGTAPLMARTQLGLRYAEFLPEDWLSPDFVFDAQYRNLCIGVIFEYLFGRLNCNFVRFYLPEESPNLAAIEKRCRLQGDGFSTNIQSSHCVISVDCTWEEFQRRKGRIRKMRQIERKLDLIGPWQVEYVEDVRRQSGVLEKILGIEKRSWKESSRNDLREVNVEQILMAFKGSSIVGKDNGGFRCSVWFLSFDDESAAYVLIIKYKGTGFVLKTSYDKKYTKTYVGKYLNNVAIQDMFNRGDVETIDFMAAYPFMSFWTTSAKHHIGFSVWKGNVAALMQRLQSNPVFSSSRTRVLDSSAYLMVRTMLRSKRQVENDLRRREMKNLF